MIRTSAATADEGAAPSEAPPWAPFGTGLRGRVAEAQGEFRQSVTGAAQLATPVNPISPELVLVDPELGRRARELLPASGEPARSAEAPADPTVQQGTDAVAPGNFVSSAVADAPGPSYRAASEPGARRASAGRRQWVSAISSVVVACALVGLAWTLYFQGPEAKRDARVAAEDPTARATPAAGIPANEAPKKPAEETGPRPMTFGWVPVRNASLYLVEFFRGGRKIFAARTSRTRVTVPAHWSYGGSHHSLVPGRYRWTVRPRLGRPAGRRFGEATVRANLVIRLDAT